MRTRAICLSTASGLLMSLAMGCTGSSEMAREVLVIAHRGANEVAPENTVAAFAAAAEMGADYVEVDIRTTLDGKLVCMHDRAVDRTTDGAGLVSDLTFDGVRSLDAGSWFDSSFARTQVPTADEVFEALKGRCGIYVDAKDVSADDVAALVRRHDAVASTIVYGNLDFHSALREIAPEIHASTWYRHDNLDRIVAAADPDWFGFSYRALSNRSVDSCHAVGARVDVNNMPVDNPEGWDRTTGCGADALMTDRPAPMLKYLRERGLHR